MLTKVKISQLKQSTGVGFGTSGIRDLHRNLTDKTVYIYTLAFLGHAKAIGDLASPTVAIAGDRRSSTPRLMAAVARAIVDSGYKYVNCGLVPTPALALFGFTHQIPSIMVTGSHIPSIRNGVKYNLSQKEILKTDERAISQMEVECNSDLFNSNGEFVTQTKLISPDTRAYRFYTQRFLDFFGPIFKGKRIGVYGHSAVGRDLMVELVKNMGGQVVKLRFAPKNLFVAIDTDKVNELLNQTTRKWVSSKKLDYIISTDGDGDRPLLTDEAGRLIRPEILPVLAGKYLNIEAIATNLTASALVEKTNYFRRIIRTKVGSPSVIRAMIKLEKEGYKKIAGYELNGGMLLQTDIMLNGKALTNLPTRDALLPIFSVLALARSTGQPVSQLVANLPQRFSYSSSIQGIPTQKSLDLLDNWQTLKGDIQKNFGPIKSTNRTDGLRLHLKSGDIVHFRPSKNAPEFRNYTESDTYQKAKKLSSKALRLIKKWTT